MGALRDVASYVAIQALRTHTIVESVSNRGKIERDAPRYVDLTYGYERWWFFFCASGSRTYPFIVSNGSTASIDCESWFDKDRFVL